MKRKTPQSGFTLVELLVSVAIFALVMTLIITSLLTMVAANRRGEALSSIVNNLNFAVESMTRNIRTGYNYVCNAAGTGGTPTNCLCPNGNAYLHFQAATGKWTTYRFITDAQGGRIERRRDDNLSGDDIDDPWLRMTAPEVVIDTTVSKFCVVGAPPKSLGDLYQPKALMIVKGSATVSGHTTSFNLQAAAVQRIPDN